ncbi:dual specificity protein phosphatase 12 [Tuber magnatum]|uniref:protein-tyrosine-phosphatase n=1 Tax=Tuber magnatum TaxID=42249 RepID=A0A317T0G0_9PEZI|nr:dual specificity protein phosphatase 12 [Tuber magnatum]
MYALRRREALEEAGITHVVSVLRLPLDKELFLQYQHKIIEVDDVEDENLLEHFPDSNKFISEALKGGGAVLIHCAMGKSRSATILTAYLMASRRLAPHLALGIIKRVRPFVGPNSGFMQQLELYHQMEFAENVEDHPIYQRWIYLRDVERSNAAGRAPERIHFRDAEAEIGRITRVEEGETPEEKGEMQLRCKKCRTTLASSTSFTPHMPKPAQPSHNEAPRQPCAHHFIEPLLWMKTELSKGEISGKLECPKCKSKVGTYAWQGLKCSCGDWIVPGISMARGKVDEVT